MSATDVSTLVGGEVKNLYDTNGWKNACALRVSLALVRSGITIPHIQNQTFQGSDGNYYFLSAAKLCAFLLKTFPNPNVNMGGPQPGTGGSNYGRACRGNKGIFIMIAKNPSLYHASGHASLFDGTWCVGGAAHTPFNMDPYGGVKQIVLWELN